MVQLAERGGVSSPLNKALFELIQSHETAHTIPHMAVKSLRSVLLTPEREAEVARERTRMQRLLFAGGATLVALVFGTTVCMLR